MMLQLVPELAERGPARVGLDLVVRVPLHVEVLPADRAEPGAVGAAEDLVGQPEDERVPRPGGEVETVVHDVRRPQLLGFAGARRLVLPRDDPLLDHRLLEAAEARPVEASDEPQIEHGSRARARDGQLRGNKLRDRDVALAAEADRLELDLLLARELLTRAQLDRAQVEDRHAAKVAGPDEVASTGAGRSPSRRRLRRPSPTPASARAAVRGRV